MKLGKAELYGINMDHVFRNHVKLYPRFSSKRRESCLPLFQRKARGRSIRLPVIPWVPASDSQSDSTEVPYVHNFSYSCSPIFLKF